jgi:hypothetical protein
MAENTGKPMGLGTIFLIIIVTGAAVGALMGILRNEFGGPAWLAGALAGGLAGGFAQVLFRRRNRTLGQPR